MSNLLDQIPSLKIFFDFEGLTKRTSVYKFQGRLQYLLDTAIKELTDFKVNAQNPDLIENALLNYVQEAVQFSGGNLSSVKPILLNVFGYRTLNLQTDFKIEEEKIRQILIWSPDCTWSYNELWNKLKPNNQSSPASLLTAPEVRQYTFGIIYQEALKSFVGSLKSPKESIDLELTSNDQKHDKFLTRQEVADYLNVSVGTIDNRVKHGLLIRIKDEASKKGAVRFRLSDVEKYLETMTSQKGKRLSKY